MDTIIDGKMQQRVHMLNWYRMAGAVSLLLLSVVLCLLGCEDLPSATRAHLPVASYVSQASVSRPEPSSAVRPVSWQEWGKPTLARARREGKLLAIDISTTACYPCQLQERLVYQDSLVAGLMNSRFLPVRIDRFERPDLARRYLSLIESSGGGWPLQVIALPDGRPLVAGNFLTPERWALELNRQLDFWRNLPLEAEDVASDEWNRIRSSFSPPGTPGRQASLPHLLSNIRRSLDLTYGAAPGEPKFPITLPYMTLLEGRGDGNEELTLTAQYLGMITDGSIYDHLGGGIMRCAEDRTWRDPCFEKTLYDNVLLLRLLARQQRFQPQQRWSDLMYEIRDFLIRDMRLSGDGYGAAIRPDSEGRPGQYYLWEDIEVRAVLGRDAAPFIHTYNMNRAGNWGRGKNVLYKSLSDEELATGYGVDPVEWRSMLDGWEDQLFQARQQRVPPELDSRQITGWQGLLVSSLVECYMVTGDRAWLNLALRTADHIRRHFVRPDGSLCHHLQDGVGHGDGFLSDYAYVLEAFFLLHRVTLEPTWVDTGGDILRYVLTYHYEPENGWFNSESPATRDWLRQYDLRDSELPSAQAVMAQQLLIASWLMNKPDFRSMVRKQLQYMSSRMLAQPLHTATWVQLQMALEEPFIVVSLSGNEAQSWFRDVHRFLPSRVVVQNPEDTRSSGTGIMSIKIGLNERVEFQSLSEADEFLRRSLGLL